MRPLQHVVLIPAVVFFAVGCSDASSPVRPDPSRLDGASYAKPPAPPAVDGVISPGEYADGSAITFTASLPSGGTTPVTVSFTRDRRYLYIATRFDRGSAFHPNDILGFAFDNDNDGIAENGDDVLLSGPFPTQNDPYVGDDFYRFDNGNSNQSDVSDGGTADVVGAYSVSGTTGTFELRHDLDSSDNAHDFSIDPMKTTQTVGIILQVSLENDPVGSNTYVHTFKPSFTTYCQLTIGKKTVSISCPA